MANTASVIPIPIEPVSNQRLAADTVDKEGGNKAGGNTDRTTDDVDQQGIAFIEASSLPEHGAVIEHHVDTDQLLESSQADSDPGNWANTKFRIRDIFQARAMMVTGEGLFNF